MAAGIWVHRSTVKGKGIFPTDMLRYDNCFPADSQAVNAIHAEPGENWTADIHKLSRASRDGFHEDRWKSFNVSIQVKAPIKI